MKDFYLVIPTCRIEHISDTLNSYDANFNRFGHEIPKIIFDDSNKDNVSELIQTTAKDVFYVGNEEKYKFIESLLSNDESKNNMIRKLFGKGYGGNRNFGLSYLQNESFLSIDDDMRPHSLEYFGNSVSLKENELMTGIFVKAPEEFVAVEQDIISGYLKLLGKNVKDVPDVARAHSVYSNMTDSEKNNTVAKIEYNAKEVLFASEGDVNPDAKIKFVRSYITKSPDIDSKDCLENFLEDPRAIAVNGISYYFVLQDYKAVVLEKDWKFTPASTAFLNENLPPFIPGDLRYEDYITRVWIDKNDDVASSIANIAHSHYRNPFRRMPLAEEYYNEVLANFTKTYIKKGAVGKEILYIEDGISLTKQDIEPVVDEAISYYNKANALALRSNLTNAVYRHFANELKKTFDRFDVESVRKYFEKRIKEEIILINSAFDVWREVQDKAYDMKIKNSLPITRLK